jgi:hypothetical protein
MNPKFSNWRKASKSEGGEGCVEVAFAEDGTVGVRDSKLGDGSPILEFTPHEWDCFGDGMTKGEFAQPA